MRLSEVGEFGLLERIRNICPAPGKRVLVGIGDDAALIQSRPDYSLVLTTDALTESIHFDLRYVPLDALGWKCLAVNLSDVAAMGGEPICCLVTMGIPDRWSVEDVEDLYQGIVRCAERYKCPVVGGDMVKTRAESFFSFTVLGEVRSGKEKKRSGAMPGDLLCVTGELGAARTGWEALQAGGTAVGSSPSSVSRFLEPKPRLDEASKLVRDWDPTSMTDISDGLASEIRHLCNESSCGCLVFEEQIPIAKEAKIWALDRGISPAQFAMESGEEYELLFTVDPMQFNRIENHRSFSESLPFSIIGEMKPPAEGIGLRKGELIQSMTFSGWDHYREAGGGA